MRLTCPICGTRGIEEFSYFGDATLKRPAPGAPPECWVDYVYIRNNQAGAHNELWYHAASCRSFLKVERNTLTHAILSTSAV
jgi:sarcosine oxidase subunit delta